MNFFTVYNQVEQAKLNNVKTAKTAAYEIPAVEPAEPEEEKPIKKTVKKQKPSEGAGAENIEQKDPAPTETEDDTTEEE